MSTHIGEKIKSIRVAEGLTQEQFTHKVEMTSKRSLGAYERKERKPEFDAIQKICGAFPQYTMYLMFDEMPANVGPDQITPEEKKLRDLSTPEKMA